MHQQRPPIPPAPHLLDLVDAALDAPIQYEGDEQLLNIPRRHVELLCDEGDAHTRVGLDDAQHHLRRVGGRKGWSVEGWRDSVGGRWLFPTGWHQGEWELGLL